MKNLVFNRLLPRYAYAGQFSLENLLPVPRGVTVGSNLTIDLSGSTLTLPTGQTVTSPTLAGTVSITGTPAFTTAPTGPQVRATSSSAAAGATVVLTAADSGKVLINASSSGSPSWTLPTAANGLYFTFVCADATAGFTVTGGTMKLKTTATGTALSGTTLTNTQGTAVVGDTITLVCNGTNWYMVAQSGIFACS